MSKIKKIMVIFVMQIFILINSITMVYASESIENQINLKSGKELPKYFKYSEYPLETKHVFQYDESGTSMPAYCLNMDKKGITKENLYSVAVNGEISDMDIGLWRIIINGYPYVSYTNLGCNDNREAFAATQHAVYLYLQSAELERYVPVGDEGQRVLTAINKILSNARNSSETKISNELDVKPQSENWEEDTDGKIAYKVYCVSSQANFDKYSVDVEGLPEDAKIVDINGNEKQEFNNEEEFKVIIPIESVEKELDIKVNVKAQVNTNPVYYGKAPSENLQNYAITKKYEEGTGSIQEKYSKPTKEETKDIEKVNEKVLPLTGM